MSLLPIKKWWRPLSITRRLIIGFTSSFVLLIILFSIIFDMIITHSVWNVAKIYARQEMSTLLAIVNNPAERDKNLMRELSWNEGEDIFYYGQVIEHGKVIASTRHMQNIFKGVAFPMNQNVSNLNNLTFNIASVKGNRYLMTALIPKNQPSMLIKLAFNITFVNKILTLIYQTSLWILIIFLVLVVWLARGIIKASLQPLKTIVQHFQKITTKNLTLQLNEEEFPEELRELVIRSKKVLNEIDRELQRLLSFSSEISHELRTPLQIMMGHTEIALASPISSEKIFQALKINLQELQSIQALIENMIILSRLDMGKHMLNYERFNVLDEMNAILSSYQIRFKEKQIECKVIGDVEIKADRILFKRIMINLLDNAIKYSQSHTSILIELYEHQGAAVIVVCDQGMGISENEIAKIFNRFYSSKFCIDQAKAGLGIGLNIVAQLMHLHRGKVEVTSVVGEGSCFRLFFPQ